MASKRKALNLGKIAGIELHVHWTFGLLIVGVFAFYLFSGHTVGESLFGLSLILALFVCVVLHEFGHALVARHFDVPTRDITLYPIGGVARLQQIPEEPKKELLISIAGPAVNVVIAGVLFAVIVLSGRLPSLQTMTEPVGHFLAKLMWFNVVIVGFNLLPAFPMDGGRVLRAVLASQMDYVQATQIAARVGQGMAILFGFLGFLAFNPILLFIALFVYLGAQQEAHMTMTRLVIEGVPVRQVMMTRYETLSPDDTLNDVAKKLLAGSEHDFPVIEDAHVVGLLTRKQLVAALAEQGLGALVRDVMQTSCPTIEDAAMLDAAFQRMQEAECPLAPVVHDGQLVGLLTLENVGEWMMIASALKGSRVRSEWRDVISSSASGSKAPADEGEYVHF